MAGYASRAEIRFHVEWSAALAAAWPALACLPAFIPVFVAVESCSLCRAKRQSANQQTGS